MECSHYCISRPLFCDSPGERHFRYVLFRSRAISIRSAICSSRKLVVVTELILKRYLKLIGKRQFLVSLSISYGDEVCFNNIVPFGGLYYYYILHWQSARNDCHKCRHSGLKARNFFYLF